MGQSSTKEYQQVSNKVASEQTLESWVAQVNGLAVKGIYRGQVKNGKPNGHGIFRSDKLVIVGDWLQDQVHGNADCYGKDFCYKGQFQHNKMCGQGVYYGYKLGVVLEGQFQDNELNGRGKYYKNGKLVFDGEFVNGDLIDGICYYDSGDKYQGPLILNKMQGYGTYTWKDGDFHKGEWINDTKWGPGEQYRQTGATVNGIKHDKAATIRGTWTNGKLDEKSAKVTCECHK